MRRGLKPVYWAFIGLLNAPFAWAQPALNPNNVRPGVNVSPMPATGVVTPAGTGQTSAAPLIFNVNLINSCPGGGLILQPGALPVQVVNNCTTAQLVYPPVGSAITVTGSGPLATNVPASVAAGSAAGFFMGGTGSWTEVTQGTGGSSAGYTLPFAGAGTLGGVALDASFPPGTPPMLGALAHDDTLAGIAADSATVGGTALSGLFAALPGTYATPGAVSTDLANFVAGNGTLGGVALDAAFPAGMMPTLGALAHADTLAALAADSATVTPFGSPNEAPLGTVIGRGLIDVRDFGPAAPWHGDAQTLHCPITAVSGAEYTLGTCTSGSYQPHFTAPDVGKHISIQLAASTPTSGPISAVAVANGGVWPQGAASPTLVLTQPGAGTGSGLLTVPYWAVQGATLVSAGANCPNGTALTFLQGGGGYVPAFLGPLTVTNGSISSVATGAALPLTANPNSGGSAAITASISGSALTVTSTAANLGNGTIVTGAGVPTSAVILGQSSGAPGGAGVYSLNVSATVASESMVAGLSGAARGTLPGASVTLPMQPWGAAPCGTAPRITLTYTLAQELVLYAGADYPAGTSYAFSGGAPTIAATPGAITLDLRAAPWSGTIASVQSGSEITLSGPVGSVPSGPVDIVYGHDDSPAYNAAIAAQASRWSAGSRADIFIPQGTGYFVTATSAAIGQGAVRGAGQNASRIIVDPAFPTGNVIDCDDAGIYYSAASPSFSTETIGIWNADTPDASVAGAGCDIGGLTLFGWKDSPNIQVAFAVSGVSQFARIHDLDAQNFTGSGLALGRLDPADQVSAFEEALVDHLRLRNDGSMFVTAQPAIDITSQTRSGAAFSASSNTLMIEDVTAFGPGGPCLSIHDDGGGSGQSLMLLRSIRCEGDVGIDNLPNASANGAVNADLVDIGSVDGVTPEANAGAESRIQIDGLFGVSVPAGFADVKTVAQPTASFTNTLQSIQIHHLVNSGASYGPYADIENCAHCLIDVSGGVPSRTAAAFVVGPAGTALVNQADIQQIHFVTDRPRTGGSWVTASVQPIVPEIDPSSAGQVRVNGIWGDPLDPATGSNVTQNLEISGTLTLAGCTGQLQGNAGAITCGGASPPVQNETFSNSADQSRAEIGVSTAAETAPVSIATSIANSVSGDTTTLTFATAPPAFAAGMTATIGALPVAWPVISISGDQAVVTGVNNAPVGTVVSFNFNTGSEPALCPDDDQGNVITANCLDENRGTGVFTFPAQPVIPGYLPTTGGTITGNVIEQGALTLAATGSIQMSSTASIRVPVYATSPGAGLLSGMVGFNSGSGNFEFGNGTASPTVFMAAGASVTAAQLPTPLPVALVGSAGWLAGRWYAAPATLASLAVPAALRPYATEITVPNAVALKSLAVHVTVADAGASNFRVLVFTDVAGAPGTALADTGAVAIAANATGDQIFTLPTPVSIGAGRVWLVVLFDTTGISVSSLSGSATGAIGAYQYGGSTPGAVLASTASTSGYAGTALASIGAAFTSFGTAVALAAGGCPQAAMGL